MSQTSLLDLPAIREPRVTRAEAWRNRLRAALLERHRGEVVTADEAVALMEARPELRRPEEVHRNAVATLFQAWDRAAPVGYERSPRDRNILRTWLIR